MSKSRRGSSGQLSFEIDEKPLEECLTARAGLPLVAEAYRALGCEASVGQHVRVKVRERGASEATIIEDFVLVLASGGEHLEDFAVLGEDAGLSALLGRKVSSPDVARKFLYRFHDEQMEEKRPQEVLAWVPEETSALEGLGRVNAELVRHVADRLPELTDFTVDMDATVIESHKAEAFRSYEGERGYQPELAVWAQTLMVLADEFRDGNVPAGMDPLSVVKRAFNVLPAERLAQMKMGFRGDTACYNHELLNWLRNERRPGGPAGPIRFAISADMSESLSRAIKALRGTAWKPYRRLDGEAVAAEADEERQWADVVFVPDDGPSNKHMKPDRYIAIRIRKRQGELFPDGSSVRHFAVVTNDWNPDGGEVLGWQRRKAGTVEQVHDMTQNGLGLGVLPCGRFGANAAWARLNVLTHNLLQALKWLAWPEEERRSHPKRLRFKFFNVAARVTRSARQVMLRLATTTEEVALALAARARLWTAPLHPRPAPS